MFVLCVSNRFSMIFKWLSLVWKTWRKEPIIMIDPTIDLTQPLQSINVTNAIQILCPKHVFKATPNKIRAIGLGIYYCLKCLKNCSCFKSFGGEWWVGSEFIFLKVKDLDAMNFWVYSWIDLSLLIEPLQWADDRKLWHFQ